MKHYQSPQVDYLPISSDDILSTLSSKESDYGIIWDVGADIITGKE